MYPTSYCKECFSKKTKAYNYNHYEKHIEEVKKWRANNPEAVKKNYKMYKDGCYSVYLLPDSNYVGQTEQLKTRMYRHKSDYKRNTDNVKILDTFDTRDEALKYERILHKQGYNG